MSYSPSQWLDFIQKDNEIRERHEAMRETKGVSKMRGDSSRPAFGSIVEVVQEGMTRRDYFAAKAMQGMIERYGYLPETAQEACKCADNLILELSK